MSVITVSLGERFVALGRRIREARIARDEKQARFAARLGVSAGTLSRLERGDPSVSLELLGRVLDLLDRVEDLDAILPEKPGILERLDAERHQRPPRRRARREARKGPA